MTLLKTSVGDFGPFHTIEIISDRLICDNIHYQFNIIGEYQIISV